MAFEQAAISLEVWVHRLVWPCIDGAHVMVGMFSELVGLLRALQEEVTRHACYVAMHASCHRADLAFKDAFKEAHAFLDVLSDSLHKLAAYHNSSPVCLKGLREFTYERGVAILKFGRLQDPHWATFAYGALRSMRQSWWWFVHFIQISVETPMTRRSHRKCCI